MKARLPLQCLVLSAALHSGGAASAQQITVQQPQQQVFEVGTVVSVPDRGSAFLGGVRSAANGRNSAFGIPGNVGAGGTISGATSSVHVTIHDFEAMDSALLREADQKQARTAAKKPRSAADVFARLHRPRLAGAGSNGVAVKPRVRSSGP